MTDNPYREALEDMVWQFGYRTVVRGRRALITGGLSALEGAFYALGWDDPHYTDEGGCEIDGCDQWAAGCGPYPRSRAHQEVDPDRVGFGFLCPEHWQEFSRLPKEDRPSDWGRR